MQLQKAQLFSGYKADETPILPPYAPSTIKYKLSVGQPINRVTLKDKNDFYAGIFDDVRDTELYIDSTDAKAGKLIKRYGEKIFGLNKENINKYIVIVEPLFFAGIQQKLGL